MTSSRDDYARVDFQTEADLCDCLIDTWNREGWTCYPETAGFDILAVRDETGHQCGIEAKLKLNDKVVSQILPDEWAGAGTNDVGPDFRAILIPPRVGESSGVCQLLGIVGVTLLRAERDHYSSGSTRGWLPPAQRESDEFTRRFDWRRRYRVKAKAERYEYAWHDWNPAKRCLLPEYVPSVRAGVPGPTRLTPWKIGALKVLAILEHQGWIDRNQIKGCGIDPRRFCASDGWLISDGQAGRWVRGAALPAFEKQHPSEYADILAKQRKSSGLLGGAK